MKILSLDTAMAACSAAVIDTERDQPLGSAFVPMERGHAEALPPMVVDVLRSSGCRVSEIERIAVTTGPGTFTGVRIGLAFARGLGLARGIPVVGIDSLSAIAANEESNGAVLVVSDARNDEVYAAFFDARRALVRPPHVSTAAGASAGVPAGTRVLGTAAQTVITASRRDDLVISAANALPVAANFARMVLDGDARSMPAPLYLRAPDAKPQSAVLRKFIELKIEHVDDSGASMLSALHGEIFEEGWSASSFQDMLQTPGTQAAVAVEHGEPLGFIVTRHAADEGEIITIGTRPSVQRRGVARYLLDAHADRLGKDGVRQLFLEVAASNASARALYVASGFVEVGRRKGYYQHRDGAEDAIVMRRELHP